MSERRPHGPGHDVAEPLDDRRYWLDDPGHVTLLLRVFFGACALLFLADLVYARHIEHAWERLPGFHPLWGFVGVLVLVFAAKALRRVVMRPEGYYGDA